MQFTMQITARARAAALRTSKTSTSKTSATSRPASAVALMPRRPALQAMIGGMIGIFGLGGRAVATAAASSPTTAEEVLQDPNFPEEFPFRPEFFERYDETSDVSFYDSPRFVTHIDDAAIASLTEFYAQEFPSSGGENTALLDICSSWISHYPKGYTAGKISGLGMNEQELARNEILTDFAVKDLNEDPSLPYADNAYDVITNCVSVDYLTKPLEIFTEMHRVLKPGGLAIMSFSNRCFPTKAISLWTSTGDLDHVWIVGGYFHYAGGFEAPKAKDITKRAAAFGKKNDPMFVVYARKKSE